MIHKTVLSQFACQTSKQQNKRGTSMSYEERVTCQTGTNGTQLHTQATHVGTAV